MIKIENSFRRILCVLLLVVMSLCALFSTAFTARADSDDEALSLLSGKTAGVMTGTPQDTIILNKVPDA